MFERVGQVYSEDAVPQLPRLRPQQFSFWLFWSAKLSVKGLITAVRSRETRVLEKLPEVWWGLSPRCGELRAELARIERSLWRVARWTEACGHSDPLNGQVGLASGPISNPRIMKRRRPSQLGKWR